MEFKIKTETDKGGVKQYIDKLDLEHGKTYHVGITVKRATRSISQNSLYWLWLTCIRQETGNDKETLHEYFKQEFLGRRTVEIFNTEVYPLRSTTGLNTKEFTDYLDKIKVFAGTELGIILPLPEDLCFKAFYERYKDFL
jgi:hypothetical protein